MEHDDIAAAPRLTLDLTDPTEAVSFAALRFGVLADSAVLLGVGADDLLGVCARIPLTGATREEIVASLHAAVRVMVRNGAARAVALLHPPHSASVEPWLRLLVGATADLPRESPLWVVIGPCALPARPVPADRRAMTPGSAFHFGEPVPIGDAADSAFAAASVAAGIPLRRPGALAPPADGLDAALLAGPGPGRAAVRRRPIGLSRSRAHLTADHDAFEELCDHAAAWGPARGPDFADRGPLHQVLLDLARVPARDELLSLIVGRVDHHRHGHEALAELFRVDGLAPDETVRPGGAVWNALDGTRQLSRRLAVLDPDGPWPDAHRAATCLLAVLAWWDTRFATAQELLDEAGDALAGYPLASLIRQAASAPVPPGWVARDLERGAA